MISDMEDDTGLVRRKDRESERKRGGKQEQREREMRRPNVPAAVS